MSASLVRPLSDLRATDIAFSGGKAANLGELFAAGLPVPDAFVIGVPAYPQSAANAPVTLSREVRDAIVENYRAMGHDVAVAVRSSAPEEDGVTASHAGIYETILNVRGTADLLDAVRQCWASATAAVARRYADARGVQSPDSGIAVVVQHQIDSASAGVVFTADPVTGCSDRLWFESARGLGESVVAGLVTPERVTVDKSSLEIAVLDSGSQESAVEIDLSTTGVVTRLLTADEVAGPALSGQQIRQIAQHALHIERWYGAPQDIEWAIDRQGRAWILQTRPITTVEASRSTAKAVQFYDLPRAAESRWTRVNIAEALPGVPSPLTWSVWRTGLGEGQRLCQVRLGVVPRREDRPAPFVTLAQGWPVLSVDLLLTQIARIPGMDPAAFSEQILGEAVPVDAAPLRARIATAIRMVARAPTAVLLQNRRLRAVSAFSRQAWQRDAWQVPEDPMALLTEASARFQRTMVVHALQTYVCQGLYQAVELVAGEATIDLLSGDGGLPEAYLIRDLQLLAHGDISMAHFLFEHGFHGPDEGELGSASWRQNPEPVLDAVRNWVDCDRSRDPVAALQTRSYERRRAESELCASLPRLRRRAVARLIAMASAALVGREVGKAAFLQDLDVARHAMSFLGDDAVWHTLSELQDKVRLDPANIRARQRVRSQFAMQEPPLAFVGNPPAPPVAQGVRSPITGLGVSPGRARGRARVVTDPTAVAALGAEDILVARTTDPSWVVRFMTASGMAIDVGGTLSHAAIIARELGIPCVIGTGDGTQAIPDGALIELDGTKGTVRILDAATDRPGSA